MANIYDMTDTWDDAGTTFTAIKMDVTNTASNSESKLLDLQVGSASQWQFRADGELYFGSSNQGAIRKGDYGIGIGSTTRSRAFIGGTNTNHGLIVSDEGALGFADNYDPDDILQWDTVFRTDGSGTIAQRNGTASQEFRLYNTYTDASNYERLSISHNGSEYVIQAEYAGTGSSAVGDLKIASRNGSTNFVLQNNRIKFTNAVMELNGWWSYQGGNGKGIYFGSSHQLTWASGTTNNSATVGDTTITRGGAGVVKIDNALMLPERSSDPSDPSEGEAVMWMSDGTGSGDDGDIMMKITAGASTKTVTLVDFSAA